MKASKYQIEKSVIKVLENGNFSLNRKFEADPAKYAEFTGQLIDDIFDEGFDPAALNVGMAILRKDFMYQRWPNTAELLAYLKQGAAASQPRIAAADNGDTPDPDKWARQMLHSQTGKQSLAQGWHLELHTWAIRHPGKTPQDEDVRQMIEAEKIGRQRIGQVRANHASMFCGASLLKIAEGFDKKKTELLAEYRPKAEAA